MPDEHRARRSPDLCLSGASGLAGALRGLKAVHDHRDDRSGADPLFLAAWSPLVPGVAAEQVMHATVARAPAATGLGGIDAAVLQGASLDREAIAEIERNAYAAPPRPGCRPPRRMPRARPSSSPG